MIAQGLRVSQGALRIVFSSGLQDCPMKLREFRKTALKPELELSLSNTASTTLATNTQLLPYTARGPATRGREGQSGRVNQNGKKTSQEALPLCPFSL